LYRPSLLVDTFTSKFLLLEVTAAAVFLCTNIHAQMNISPEIKTRPSNAQLALPSVAQHADAFLRCMTLDEKLGQLVQYNDAGYTAPTAVGEKVGIAVNPEASYKLYPMKLAATGRLGSMLNIIGAAKTNAFQKAAIEQSRLHIPILFGADIIHGFRTIYPVPLGLAASFDPFLVERVSRFSAQEATTAGVQWFYSPMVDISRDARWGRSTEGTGEDPYLGAAMARAYIMAIKVTISLAQIAWRRP
jgi:beta-glucosidase